MSWCWQKKKKNGNACLSSYVKGYELLRLHYFKKLKHKILRRMTSLALSTKENKGKTNKDPFLLVFQMFLLSAHNSGLHTFSAKDSRVDNVDFVAT